MRDISLHLLDILQNSLKAHALSIKISLVALTSEDTLVITIADDGRGMSAETLSRVQDPFFTTRTERKVGLGLSLFKANARLTGGDLTITSAPGLGTTVRVTFGLSHIDRPPLGNLGLTFATVLGFRQDLDLGLFYQKDHRNFSLTTEDLLEVLEDPSAFESPRVLAWIEDYIETAIQELATP